MMDVDQRAADRVEKRRGQYLHVAGQHHQIHIAAEQLKLTLFGLVAGFARGRDVYERHAEGPHTFSQSAPVVAENSVLPNADDLDRG